MARIRYIFAILIMEFMIFYDMRIMKDINLYMNHTFDTLPYYLYFVGGYLLFGMLFMLVTKWLWTQKIGISVFLLLLNIILIPLSRKATFFYSYLGMIFIGTLLMICVSRFFRDQKKAE